MSNAVTIPYSIWQEVSAFFERLVAPCKECVRGNPVSCWHSQCAAFQFREISRAVLSVRTAGNQKSRPIPNHIKIENEILQALAEYDRPVPPSALKLWTVNSKSAKSKAISRLIKRGCIIEERASDFVRYISLPKKKESGK